MWPGVGNDCRLDHRCRVLTCPPSSYPLLWAVLVSYFYSCGVLTTIYRCWISMELPPPQTPIADYGRLLCVINKNHTYYSADIGPLRTAYLYPCKHKQDVTFCRPPPLCLNLHFFLSPSNLLHCSRICSIQGLLGTSLAQALVMFKALTYPSVYDHRTIVGCMEDIRGLSLLIDLWSFLYNWIQLSSFLKFQYSHFAAYGQSSY